MNVHFCIILSACSFKKNKRFSDNSDNTLPLSTIANAKAYLIAKKTGQTPPSSNNDMFATCF